MDQATKLPPLKWLSFPDYHGREDIGIEYAFFDNGGPHIPRRICVFSASPHYAHSLVLYAERVIDAICQKDGISWRDVWFCDMQTHHADQGISRGYYTFQVLVLKDNVRQSKTGTNCPSVGEWRSIECPLPVFERFEELIGSFLTIDELLDRSLPCYKGYSDKQMRAEREALVGHRKWVDEFTAKHHEENKHRLVSIDEAFVRGCRLMPWGIHLGSISEKVSSSSVIVDLQGSHLLGQCTDRKVFDPLKRPDRYSLWRRELEWYPLKMRQTA